MEFNSKLPNVGTTIFTQMSALAATHEAINLSQGFPNFKSDEQLIKLVHQAMLDGKNQYAPMVGVYDLRKAISNKFDKLYGSSYHPETEITITAGATQAIFTAISAFISPEDEVIIFRPAYDCYEPAIELNGGRTISIQLRAPDFKVNWQEVKDRISDKTKMIIINTPQNPSGTLFSKKDMERLEQLTDGTDILVLSDEVYEHLVYDGEQHQSACLFPGLKSRSLITASFGKTFHNTGWKVGYCCADKLLMEEFRKVHQFNVFSVNHPVQDALAEYISKEENYLMLATFYQEKRDLFLSLINDSRFDCIPAKGTYFQALSYAKITDQKDVEFAEKLTVENGIASIPMSVFNDGGRDDHLLRFCFAKTDQTLKAAAQILCAV